MPPVGTFTIWSLIIALSIGYAIWADSDRRPDPRLRDRLTWPLLIACVGFSAGLRRPRSSPTGRLWWFS